MIDLKELRRRVSGFASDQGVYGPTWLNPSEAEHLLDMLEAAKIDAARWREAKTGRYFSIIDGCGDEVRNEAADEAIDVFLAATQGEA